ncbi:YcaO-like family protein [Lutibacter sp. B2]|nr:YcaO-like family protein [Lutibacter sp. B2]
MTPPTIPKSYLEDFPKINNMIKQIDSNGNYEVIVKDCSLNKGYPVVCVLYINKDDQTYFIKFGAHPIFEIAVERTLTELFQGQNIKSMKGVK